MPEIHSAKGGRIILPVWAENHETPKIISQRKEEERLCSTSAKRGKEVGASPGNAE
jgi:hypothetical protein